MPRPVQWLIDKALADVALEVRIQTGEGLTDGAVQAIARTAVQSVLRLLPEITQLPRSSPDTGHGLSDPLDPDLGGLRTGAVDDDSNLIDTRFVIMLGQVHTALVGAANVALGESRMGYVLQLDGRINQTEEHVRFAYLMEPDGAASVIAEIIALSIRAGVMPSAQLSRSVTEQLNRRIQEGPTP